MSTESIKKDITEQSLASELMTPEAGAKATTMEEDFSELKGEELISQRTAGQKVFDLGEGRRQAITYGEPVHFRAGGSWKDIDNRLTYDEKTGMLRTGANAYTTALAAVDDGRATVSLSREGVEFSFGYLGETNGAEAEVLPPEKTEHANEQEARADLSGTLHSGVRYAEFRPGMDVEIHIDGRGLKDNIILKTAEALNYAGLALPEGFEYRAQENGDVAVYLNGKEYITVSAPYAYDANGNEICVKSKLDGNLLRYEADAKGDTVYPVTIDPYISYYNSSETMYTAFIYNKSPNSNYRYNYLYCGVRTATSGNPEYITFVRPLSLAAQRASDTILSAKIYMKVSDYGNLEWYLGAYPVKTAWTESGVTWNNMTPANDTHISYDMLSYISKVAGESWAGFDITEAYKGWYKKDAAGNHTNYGIAIRRACAASYNYAEFYSSRISEGKPYITVNYVSHAGRKGWWKYETMGAGRAGAVYTDIYNGNLIAEHADTATAGSRMPVSLSHIYNSCLSDEDAAYCGLGWRLSLSQSLRKETIVNKQYYIWQDGDGTEHYFEASGTQPYSDSEGMQLKLRVNGSDITVTDKSDTVMSFPVTTSATRVYLSSVTDAQGNSMTLSYDPGAAGKLVSVTDGVGRVTVLGYNADGLLDSITAPGCPVVSYTYSGDSTDGWRLTRINYSDIDSTQYTEYGYDVHDGIQTATLTVLRNYDGIQTNVVYDTELDTTYIGNYTEQTRKVVSLEQTGDENGVTVKGAKKLIQYGHMHTGIKHVSGTDSDDDGRSIINHFNNAGNVLSAHDEMWHAAAARYDSGIDNTPSATSGVIKSIINRLPNTDMYSGWTQVKAYSGDTRTFDTGVTCMGMPSAKLVKNGAGEFKERITAKLFGSGEYTLSAYLKTNGLTVPGGCKGAFLRVTANGNTYESRGALSATAGMGTGTFAEGWERLNVCFPFEYGTDVSVTAELVCDASGGTLYWSCPQLEEGRLAGSFNLLSDGDFSLTVTNNDGSAPRLWPQKWNKVGTVGTSAFNCVVLDRSVNGLPDGVSGNALRLKCTPRTTDVYMAQEVRACGANGDVFTIAGWCSADKTAIGTSGYAPMLGVRFYSSSNTYSSWKYISFGTQRSGWHLVRQQVTAPNAYTRVQVGVFYSKNADCAMFTHINFCRELYGNVYTYDDNGNPIYVKDRSNQQSAATYDSYDNLLSYVQPGSATTDKYLFTYGSTDAEKKKHLPRTATTPEGVKTSTTYDSYGNALTGTIQENSSSPLIKTETEYTANGNYVVKQKDARGNEVTNTLDANGKVLSVTDPDNQEVEYTYDSSNRVTKVETVYPVGGVDRTSKNEYTYENDRIKTVAHNTASDNASDVRYTFNYDSLGRKTSVTVSNGSPNATEQVLSTNVYSNDRKSLLDEVQYGNGGKVKYSYDEYDRVTGITHDSDTDPKFAYEYDSRGRAAVVTDTRDGSVIRNNYDQSDRPAESEQRDGNGDLKYRTLINYDIKNRVKDLNEATGNGTHKTEYAYDKDNRVTAVRYNGSNTTKVDYTYDKLNRITGRKTTNGVEYNTQYGYVQGASAYGSNATTPLVASITQGSGANAFSLAYTYDSRGNITSETRNSVTTTYEYDKLGQLVRVNDPNDPTAYNEGGLSNNGTTWIYAYDRGGNILSKTAYEFTTGTVGTAVRTYLYGYTDTNWKDKLTSFDNSTITYDAIGNPLSDGTWTYVWQAGRQLRSMSRTEGSNTVTVEFTYNHAGLRTKKEKKVNGTVTEETEYILNGKNVVELIHTVYTTVGNETTATTDVLHFYYDAQGRAALVKYNGVMYSYVHDLQGDVIGLLDNTGNVAVEYKYDAWGKPLGVTGTLAETLGILNPFRYRGYVFDEETQLYYLRSRFYEPNKTRFICIDISIIGGNESLPYNSFSYCANSPIAYLDIDGDVRLYGLEVTFYGFFHAIIQKDIIRLNPGVKKEQYPAEGSLLRIDLQKGNHIFEIKPDNEPAKALGKSQLKAYIIASRKSLKKGNASKELILPKYEPLRIGNITVQLIVKACGPLVLYQVNVETNGIAPAVVPVIPRKNPFVLKDEKRIVNYNYAFGDATDLLPGLSLVALAVFAGGSFGNYLARPDYN